MQKNKFYELWKTQVIDYLESPASGCLHKAYNSKRISFIFNAKNIVYYRYERIKNLFKTNFFKNPDEAILDRHKRAAILTYAFIDVSPIAVADLRETDSLELRLINECLGFYFGLYYLTIDYKPEAIERIVKEEGSVFFSFPDNYFAKCSDNCEENHYLSCIWKDLFFSKEYRNYNILTMANIFYLLEVNYCKLLPSEIYDDLKPETKLNIC